MALIGNQKKPQFSCENCSFDSNNKKDYSKHLLTRKHATMGNPQSKKPQKTQQHDCSQCDKVYDSKSGLWRHLKTCTSQTNKDKVIDILIKENTDFKNILLEIVKSNSDLQKQFADAYKNNTTIHNNSHNNNNNKTFNLQIFLNENCKDAMNMSEFVDSFDLQLSDLESVGELGYVEGMTKIFIDKLNSMDVCKRPMHCSDARREIIYIKDENRWEREKPSNPMLRRAVKRVTFKNMKLTNLWSDTHPESKCNESRSNDVYIKLVLQSTGGSGEISDSEDKIIRRIAKGIVIDKSLL
jgi:hypothetical protein